MSLLVPIFFIAYFILSIVLFIKREAILHRYNVGYISSFFFAAYMLAPVFMGLEFLANPGAAQNSEVPPIIVLIYPIIGILVFHFFNLDLPINERIGKFFAMLGIGICAALILVFKMLTMFHYSSGGGSSMTSQSTGESNHAYQKMLGKSLYDNMGNPNGRIGADGYIYDKLGNPNGRIDADGYIYDNMGNPNGRIDVDGYIYDKLGNPNGRIDADGYIHDKIGNSGGRIG